MLLIDIRSKEQYEKYHIRESSNIDPKELTEEKLLELVKITSEVFSKFNPKKHDSVKRLVVITEGPLKTEDPIIKSFISMIKASRSVSFILTLKNGIESVKEIYPCIFVNKDSSEQDYGFAASRFPSVITEGKLYLGNFLNAGATKQLDSMGITTLISISVKPMENIDKKYKYIHFPFKENNENQQIFLLDFDGVFATITECMENNEKVLVFSVV